MERIFLKIYLAEQEGWVCCLDFQRLICSKCYDECAQKLSPSEAFSLEQTAYLSEIYKTFD